MLRLVSRDGFFGKRREIIYLKNYKMAVFRII
jgi:hypothetical protein